MKTLEFSSKSWHFRLATEYGPLHKWMMDDVSICEYISAVLRGSISVLLLTSFAAIVLYIFPVQWLMFIISQFHIGFHFYNEEFADVASALSLGFLILMIFAFLLTEGYMRVKSSVKNVHVPDGFLKEAYKSVKTKTCVRVNFK